MAKSKWIPENLHEGVFTNKAKERGMGVQEFANYVIAHREEFDVKTLKQANLAKTFKKIAEK